ncbi:MAG: type II toxin-antitoxin system RelE/ParE family toxin [Bacteroidales bacterium]|nr:type II toxin-antitoxin system RelE/ParE family toxin [Bacteroidales bacterium]
MIGNSSNIAYKLLIHKNVTKFLKKCPIKQQIISKFELLKQNPYPNQELDIKIIQGYENLYRLRVGKYRFIYKIQNDELIIFILKAGSRGDIYKK